MFIIHSYWGRLSQSLWHICHFSKAWGSTRLLAPVILPWFPRLQNSGISILKKDPLNPDWNAQNYSNSQKCFFLSISLLDCIYAKELKSSKTPQQIWSSPDGHQQGGAFRIVQVSRIQLMWRLYLYYQINQIVINLNIHKWKLICWSGKTPGWLVCTSMLEVKYIFSTICEIKQNLGGASREVRWRV